MEQYFTRNSWSYEDQNIIMNAILEASLDAIVTIDSNGQVIEWNRAATEIFGHSRDEAIGQPLADLIIPDEFRQRHHIGFARFKETKKSELIGRRLELKGLHKSGHVFPIELAIATFVVQENRFFVARLRNISGRIEKEQKLKTIVDEMHHRVKNTMAVILSIARQTSYSSVDLPTFFKDFEARLVSLSATHNLLAQQKWSAVTIDELFKQELKPYEGVTISGPKVEIAPRPALTLGMCIHEMMTNSAKYGSLSVPGGTINIYWTADDTNLEVFWIERGGPRLDGPPARKGFGSKMMRAGFFTELGGVGNMDFAPEGLNGHISVPLKNLK